MHTYRERVIERERERDWAHVRERGVNTFALSRHLKLTFKESLKDYETITQQQPPRLIILVKCVLVTIFRVT